MTSNKREFAQFSVTQFQSECPSVFVATEESECEAYARDASGTFQATPSAVLKPSSTEQVSEVLSWCHRNGVAVIPCGGRSGLAGGITCFGKEVLLSLERMTSIGSVDLLGRSIEVEAGVVTQVLLEALESSGLMWPIDLAAKGSSQIGGNLATNAGGVRAVRYGSARNWVLGLTAVTMSGEVLELGGHLHKDNCGYDLKQLLIGSEGTLAVITKAVLKLVPRPQSPTVIAVSVENLASVVDLFPECEQHGGLQAFEWMEGSCLEGLESPFAEEVSQVVLAEFEGTLEESFAQLLLNREGVQDVVLSQSSEQRENLWSLREGMTERLRQKGVVFKFDVAVPVAKIVSFMDGLSEISESVPVERFAFGHIGDGNLHLNWVSKEESLREEFSQRLNAHVLQFGGTMTAEHGVGVLKRASLKERKSTTEVALMQALKQTWDPEGLLNPGKILEQERL